MTNVGADPPEFRGRRKPTDEMSDIIRWPHRGNGVGMHAEGIERNTGNPSGGGV